MSCLQVDLLNLPERRDSRLLPGQMVMWLVKKSCVRCTWLNQAFVHGRGFWRRSAFGVSCSQNLLTNVTKLTVPLQLETPGDLTLNTIGDLLCGGVVCHGCVFNPLLSVSLFGTAGYGLLKRPKGNVKLERSGGLDDLVGGEERCVFLLCSHLARSMEVTVA